MSEPHHYSVSLKKWSLLRIWERFGHLESDNDSEQLDIDVMNDLVIAFGPVSEGRYLRPPFEVSEMKPHSNDSAYSSLPTLFEAEHLASLSRLKERA